MASDPDSSGFRAFFRDLMPWTGPRTISRSSSDDLGPRAQPTSGAPQDPLPMSVRLMNLVVPTSINITGGGVPRRGAWKALIKALQVLESSLEGFPQLKTAIGGLVSCAQHVKTAQKNQKQYRSLASDLTSLVGSLQSHLPKSRPTRMPYSVSNVARAIEEHTAYLKRKHEQRSVTGYIMASEDSEDVLERYRRIEALFRQLQAGASTWILAHEQLSETRLEGLAASHKAYYNSTLSMEMQRRGCTKNTRQKILDDTLAWTSSPDAAKVYWMNGMAGTGKTTIAYSLCEMLKDKSQLGGSFFCSRNSPDCRDVSRIVPTISYQLARFSNPYQSALCDMLGNEPDVARLRVDAQFKKLLLQPLTSVKDAMPQDVVIVIDALDECTDGNAMSLVLDLVFRYATELPVKFFITSRPEPNISNKMMCHGSTSRSILHLHDIEASLVQSDIQVYLTEALESIHPNMKDLECLAARAGCLFIFAATVVRYIAPSNLSVNHRERLSTMLQATSTADKGRYKEVDDIYSTILSMALEAEGYEAGETKTRQMVLWTVVCASEPLDAPTLAQILDIEDQQKLQVALEPLRSVLHVSQANGVISTLHASFPDFLLSPQRSGRFTCNKTKHDEYLASQCFSTMAHQLRFNICDLKSSYLLDSEVPDLDTRVDRAISSGLSYACRYWGDHLANGMTSAEMIRLLDEFMKRWLLLWMEVLNLKRWMRHAENIVTQVLIWLPKNDSHAELYQLAYDARNFITSFTGNAVSLSTPHIYISTLPFTSTESLVRLSYWPRTRGLVRIQGKAMEARAQSALAVWSVGSGVGCLARLRGGGRIASGLHDGTVSIWDASTGTRIVGPLQGHDNVIWSIAFSPDGARIASGSYDCTIRVWDARTGGLVAGPLLGHEKCVSGLSFSPDSPRLVSSSDDHTIRMWNTVTSAQLGEPLMGHQAAVMTVVFSPDGKRIASGSDDHTIRIWDPESHATIAGPFVGHTDWITSIAFSSDGVRLVSGSSDHTVRVWDTDTGETVAGPFEGHVDRVRWVAFSPDDRTIASGSHDRTIRVWDSHDGRLIAGPFDGHRDKVNAVVFSTDGTRVYSGSDDGTICVWDARDGTTGGNAAAGHNNKVRCVAFSPDGTRAASGSDDNSVCVWDTGSGALVASPFTGHTNWVYAVAFSPDGARIVSGSFDCTLRTWDASTGALLVGPFEGHTNFVTSVTFSPDRSRIASGSYDGIIRLWNSTTGIPIGEPFTGHTSTVRSVAFSHDGARIVSGSRDETVRMWDATNGNLIWTSDAHTNWVLSVVFSPDGTRVVSGSRGCTVVVLDARDGAVLHGPTTGPTDSAFPLSLSPDGTRVVSISSGQTMHVWETQSGKIVAGPFQGYGGGISSVAFSSDGTRVIAGYANGLVRVWDVASAMQPTASLFHDWSINGDGWLMDSDSRRVLWVPSDLRQRISLSSASNSVVTAGGCTICIEDASLVGDRWGGCYDASQGLVSR